MDTTEVSTITQFNAVDEHSKSRENGAQYEVSTISLNDLLNKYNVPLDIDFLSIDAKGSEFKILNSFDFSKYNIKIIFCEHNYTPMREKIYLLLSQYGYTRKYQSDSIFD